MTQKRSQGWDTSSSTSSTMLAMSQMKKTPRPSSSTHSSYFRTKNFMQTTIRSSSGH